MDAAKILVVDTALCSDIFNAVHVRDYLCAQAGNEKLSKSEYLIYGKVDRKAIAGCVSAKKLEDYSIHIIAPDLDCHTTWKWKEKMEGQYPSHRPVTDDLLATAVGIAYAFRMEDGRYIVERLLSTDFRIYDGNFDRAWIDREMERQRLGKTIDNLTCAMARAAGTLDLLLITLTSNVSINIEANRFLEKLYNPLHPTRFVEEDLRDGLEDALIDLAWWSKKALSARVQASGPGVGERAREDFFEQHRSCFRRDSLGRWAQAHLQEINRWKDSTPALETIEILLRSFPRPRGVSHGHGCCRHCRQALWYTCLLLWKDWEGPSLLRWEQEKRGGKENPSRRRGTRITKFGSNVFSES